MMLVEQLQSDLIAKGYKNAYINKVLNVFKAMFTKAVEWEMVEEDVLRRVRKVKMLRENKRLRYLTVEECRTLIDACDKHLKPIVITALNTGMRRGEILGLQRKHLDLTHGFILLDKTKNGDRREIPINKTMQELFESIPKRLDSTYIFCHKESGLPYGDIKHSFDKARKRTKLDDLHFHDLRHTFASHLVMAGVDLTTVKELLGHKDIKMTLRYAHLAPSHKMKAVDILDKAFEPASTSQKLHNLRIVENSNLQKPL
jgi:integrase